MLLERSDEDLIRDYDAGTSGAAEVLYQRYFRPLYIYARALSGSEPLAEDLVQESFLRLFSSDGSSEFRSVKAFLFTVLRRRATDEQRRASVRRKALPLIVERTRADAAAVSRDSVCPHELSEALEGLPAFQMEAVVLKVFTGHTFSEIGQITDVSPATAKSRYRAAIERLGDLLSKEALI